MTEKRAEGKTIQVVKVPDVGEGIAEVEVVVWHVQPGDAVAADQVVADLMTDKATVEIPSPVSGRVIALGGKVGEKLAVGSELLRIEKGGDGGADAGAPSIAAPTTAALAETAPATKPLASPSVRRQSRELGIDLKTVKGSGPQGRILRQDLERHAARGRAVPAARQQYAERSGEQAVPVIGLRRQIAQRMQESKRRIPHFTYVEEVDLTELEALRTRLNEERGEARGRLTILPFLMRAIVLAVPSFPQLNARYDDENGVVTQYGAVHIGIATQTKGGLMVPVVRHAEARDLWSSAAEIVRLAEAARAGKATREELSGSTITITSLGPLGGIVTTPIINAPEVAVIGVNRIVERPVIHSGTIVPRRIMNLSSSFDHRVVDGQDAAEFVQALRGYLDCPATLFVD